MYRLKHLHILRAPNLVGMVTFPGKYRSYFPGHVNFDRGQVKVEVWWPVGQLKLASVVLSVCLLSDAAFIASNLMHFVIIYNLL